MKSLKSHFSLITALFSILITLQLFLSLERVITAYEAALGDNYGIVVVTDGNLTEAFFKNIDSSIKTVETLSPKHILQQLQQVAGDSDINLMELNLPHFYRLRMDHFVSPDEAKTIHKELSRQPAILRVETFAHQHDTIFRLLLLFKGVVTILAAVLFLVTSLLIVKEMRLWQFQHRERMNIMALFGAPVWLRSAVLFRLAIVDAVIASIIAALAFILVDHYGWVSRILELIQVRALLFDPLHDIPILFGVSVTLSILLASMIVMGHKEEV
jgi:cell division transport system permease protein